MSDPSPEKVLFSQWLASFGDGALDDELTAALEELAHAVLFTEKSGALSVKLALSEKGGGVVVSAAVQSTPPKSKREQFFYVNDGVGLTRRDPRQPTLTRPDGAPEPGLAG